MKFKIIPAALVIATVLLGASAGHAQNIGFAVGLAPANQPVRPAPGPARSPMGVFAPPQPPVRPVAPVRPAPVATVIIVQPTTVIYVQQTVPFPAPGTPRAEIIQRWGTPLLTIITYARETLQYSGGVTIVLQNGFVR